MAEATAMITDAEHTLIRQALSDLDALAQAMERKWGIGRLELAVPVALRDKFRRQGEKLDAALSGQDAQEQLTQIGGMSRAWSTLDAKATADGISPAPAEWWEVALEDGTVAALIRDATDWPKIAEMAKARQMAVFTLEEVGRLLTAYDGIVEAKLTFPGATVAKVRPKSLGGDLNDALGIPA